MKAEVNRYGTVSIYDSEGSKVFDIKLDNTEETGITIRALCPPMHQMDHTDAIDVQPHADNQVTVKLRRAEP